MSIIPGVVCVLTYEDSNLEPITNVHLAALPPIGASIMIKEPNELKRYEITGIMAVGTPVTLDKIAAIKERLEAIEAENVDDPERAKAEADADKTIDQMFWLFVKDVKLL
jgi:hypothetical protein